MLSVAAAMITVTMGGRMVTDFVVTMATCVFFFPLSSHFRFECCCQELDGKRRKLNELKTCGVL